MSKVNVDEIQVGDLVEYQSPNFEDSRALGIVTNIDGGIWGFWSDEEPNRDLRVSCTENIVGHWKVINFEEESKMNDELKVYTGKETLQALLEGKTLEYKEDNCSYQYKSNDKVIEVSWQGKPFQKTNQSINFFLTREFTEVVLPQVGDWVRVTHSETKAVIITGEITEIDNLVARIEDRLISLKQDWEILSPEQVSEYKRELAFSKVGRKLNEFRSGDIVCINADGSVSIVVSNNNEESVRLHMLNVPGKGYTAKPHQLTPICFAENQVDLS